MSIMVDSSLIKIGVIGVGGGGCNAVEMMVHEREAAKSLGSSDQSVFEDVTLIVANTDSMDLDKSSADVKIQLGANLTSGWGAGADPEKGRESAEENKVEIASAVEDFDMLFITAGMGGGTGTGASSVIASVAAQTGILTVGVVTMPFSFEGRRKMRIASEYLEKLEEAVDSLVVIPNEKLIDIAEATDDSRKMFQKPNEVLIDAVKNIAGLICDDSFINVDFADVNKIMRNMGKAMIGIGSATGENAAINSVKEALNNPLLSDISIEGSTRVLLHFGGMSMPLKELNEAANFVNKQVNDEAEFIWGASVKDDGDKTMAIIVAEASSRADGVAGRDTVANGQQKLFDNSVPSHDEEPVPTVNSSRIDSIIENELLNDDDDSPEIEVLTPAAESHEETVDNIIDIKQETMSRPDDDEMNLEIPEDDIKIPAYLRKKNKKHVREDTSSSGNRVGRRRSEGRSYRHNTSS